MSKLQIRRRGYALGAEITGIDASAPLDRETIEAIRQAWLDHIVVYLPGQNLSAEQLRAFSAQFGTLDVENIKLLPLHPQMPEVVVRSNQPVPTNGAIVPKSPPADVWHSDYAQSLRPQTITFLLAKQIPSVGGDTMWSNLYMAYESLSPGMKKLAGSLDALFDTTRGGRYQKSSADAQAKIRSDFPPIVRPVVQTHPETGRRYYFVTERTSSFAGMTAEESKPLLDYLSEHATRYEFVYRHRWNVNDLVMWDNRVSLHIAVQDYAPEARTLIRCALEGPVNGSVYAPGERTAEAVAR